MKNSTNAHVQVTIQSKSKECHFIMGLRHWNIGTEEKCLPARENQRRLRNGSACKDQRKWERKVMVLDMRRIKTSAGMSRVPVVTNTG